MGSATGYVPFTTQHIHDVVHRIRQDYQSGRTHILFNCQPEPLNSIWLHYVQRVVDLLPEIPNEQFFFITGAIDAQQDYVQYCQQHHITRPIRILPVQGWESFARNNLLGLNQHDAVGQYQYEPHHCEKLFLNFNRRVREHRTKLMAHFFEQGWVDRSYVSFAGTLGPGDHHMPLYTITSDRHVHEQFVQNQHRLPLVLNMDQNRPNPIHLYTDDLDYYRKSYLSVVTETLYQQILQHGNWEEFGSVFLSEKIFKPMAMKHPFILVSRHGTLAKLHQRGYQTFGPWIDESYDQETSATRRMELIVRELDRLAQFTDQQWLDWQQAVLPAVEHNYRHLLGQTRFHDIPDLLNYMGLDK